jgi:hypothetical protein
MIRYEIYLPLQKPLITSDYKEVEKYRELYPSLMRTEAYKDNVKVAELATSDDYESWRINLERTTVWPMDRISPDLAKGNDYTFNVTTSSLSIGLDKKPADAINPNHYQNYIQDLQWLEAMQYIPTLRDPAKFKAAVELQIRKYLDRNGGKDKELQELQKSLWYMKFLVAYIKNGEKPIRVKDIDEILARK